MEKSLKHLYFEILEYLSVEGIGVDTNIKELCGRYVNKKREEETCSDAFDAFSQSWTRVVSYLSSLEKSGYIKYSNEHNDLGQLYIVGGNFSASITKEGLDYNYTHQLRKASLTSLKNQWLFNSITWLIACGSLALAVYTSCQNSDLTQNVKELNSQVRLLKLSRHIVVETTKSPPTVSKKAPTDNQ